MEEKTIKQEDAVENKKEIAHASPLEEEKQKKRRFRLSFGQLVTIAIIAAVMALASWKFTNYIRDEALKAIDHGPHIPPQWRNRIYRQ